MGPKNNAIELKNVCYRAGPSFEIRDLTLNVPYGSICGFLGPNGSGKTTTIRLFIGMHQATSGSPIPNWKSGFRRGIPETASLSGAGRVPG